MSREIPLALTQELAAKVARWAEANGMSTAASNAVVAETPHERIAADVTLEKDKQSTERIRACHYDR